MPTGAWAKGGSAMKTRLLERHGFGQDDQTGDVDPFFQDQPLLAHCTAASGSSDLETASMRMTSQFRTGRGV